MKTFTYEFTKIGKLIFGLSILFLSIEAFAAKKHVVEVSNNKYTPADLTIGVGDTVEWKNIQGFHNVNGKQTTYAMNPESFGNATGSGWTYKFVFTKTGVYDYQCDPHVGLGMVAKVRVVQMAAKHIVQVTNNVFTPKELKINPGDTVEWKNTQGFHNVNGKQTTYPGNPESFGNSTGSGWTYKFVFTKSGKYDYQCDPHVGLGMVGKVEVAGNDDPGKKMLTVNFTGMTPHVGQTLWLAVKDQDSGKEVERKKAIVAVSFSVSVSGIELNHSYYVDFYSDHNKNGSYDAPPADHAWRLEANNVTGDVVLNFAHNTTFTDIKWQHKLMVHFMSMTPHVGQKLKLAVVEKATGIELDRVSATVAADFMVEVSGIKSGTTYNIDFFSDHNKNGMYDAPPADHAWRMELSSVKGDTTLNFTHNTTFTNIDWNNKLMVHFMGMTPHVGQNLTLLVVDKTTGIEVNRVSATVAAEFMLNTTGLKSGKSYNIDFYSDHNKNGVYDAPPADHAWRIELNNVKADTTLMFTHNTNFTDIKLKTAVETVNSFNIRMYPNPAKNRIRLETGELSGNGIEVYVRDLTGRTRLTTTGLNSNVADIDLQTLSSGLYLVEVRNGNKRSVLKLIKEQ